MNCGVVASRRDFGKVQSKKYVRQEGDVCLGERTIPFRIFAHNPREMPRYSAAWAKAAANNWKHNEARLQYDLFCHRFGKRPTPQMILDSIPTMDQQHIPKTGAYRCSLAHRSRYEAQKDALYEKGLAISRDKFAYWNYKQKDDQQVSVDETEGILLDNPADVVIIRELAAFDSQNLCHRGTPNSILPFNLTANWDTTTRTGVSFQTSIIRGSRHNRN